MLLPGDRTANIQNLKGFWGRFERVLVTFNQIDRGLAILSL
jgi:hypothetical protein